MNKHNNSLREEPAKIFEKALRKVEPLIVAQYSCRHQSPQYSKAAP